MYDMQEICDGVLRYLPMTDIGYSFDDHNLTDWFEEDKQALQLPYRRN